TPTGQRESLVTSRNAIVAFWPFTDAVSPRRSVNCDPTVVVIVSVNVPVPPVPEELTVPAILDPVPQAASNARTAARAIRVVIMQYLPEELRHSAKCRPMTSR